jgi:hypothetical protein
MEPLPLKEKIVPRKTGQPTTSFVDRCRDEMTASARCAAIPPFIEITTPGSG